LVGDSVANTVLGFPDTLHVTIDDMARHTGAVARADPTALVVGDLPWMSYHTGTRDAVRNAAALVRAGAACVKLEGGAVRVPVVEAILAAQIPVMGHLGLTPQSVLAMGGYRVQGRDLDAAKLLLDDAHALEDAGCFALVLEGVPDALAAKITAALGIPTIGIGAGPDTDGQVLVFHDLLGLGNRPLAKFVREYAQLGALVTEAVGRFAADVRSGAFPGRTRPTPRAPTSEPRSGVSRAQPKVLMSAPVVAFIRSMSPLPSLVTHSDVPLIAKPDGV